MALVEAITPPPDAALIRRATLESQRWLHSLGITNWQDAWVTPDTEDVYLELAGAGELTARVVARMWWERDQGLEQIEGFVERRAKGVVGRFAATSVKLMCDGIVENQTASMTEPYFDVHGHQPPTGAWTSSTPRSLRRR